jgi:uncharacterized membrane protein
MMRLKLTVSTLAFALCATSALAEQPVRYRLQQIGTNVFSSADMNEHGMVVGAYQVGASPHGFAWHDGVFVDLHDRVSPTSPYVEASGTNDRSQIDGIFIDPTLNAFRGFLLDRNGRLIVIDGPAGSENVFVHGLNNREQLLGDTFNADGIDIPWLWDRGEIRLFENFAPVEINDRGVVSGTSNVEGCGCAAIWEDGEIMPIGPSPSTGGRINERGQVVGQLVGEQFRGFVWTRGELTVLPALRADQASNFASDINNRGSIVGGTDVVLPEETLQFATLWPNKEEVVDLNTLIDPNDPLRSFVTLQFASLIDDRGEIVSSGRDSRTGTLALYLLTPVHQ